MLIRTITLIRFYPLMAGSTREGDMAQVVVLLNNTLNHFIPRSWTTVHLPLPIFMHPNHIVNITGSLKNLVDIFPLERAST